MRAQEMTLGHASVIAMSISFSGELSYELHVPNEQLYLVWKLINGQGASFNLSKFGLYATESMRMEKGYRHWKADLIYERNPIEAGLDRFVKLDKPEFIGKSALLEEIKRGPERVFVALTVDCDIAAAHAGDSLYSGDSLIGSVTSGDYGHRVKKNIAYAFVKPEYSETGKQLTIGILGKNYPAQVCEMCLYDPQNLHVRA